MSTPVRSRRHSSLTTRGSHSAGSRGSMPRHSSAAAGNMPRHSSAAAEQPAAGHRRASAEQPAGHRRANRKYGAKYLLSSDRATFGEDRMEPAKSAEMNPMHCASRPLSPGARAVLPVPSRQHSRVMSPRQDSFFIHGSKNTRDGGKEHGEGLKRSESRDERNLSRKISVDPKLKNQIIEEAVKKARERQILKLQEYASSKPHGAKVERKETSSQHCKRRESSRREDARCDNIRREISRREESICENIRRETSRRESINVSRQALNRRDTNVKYPVQSQEDWRDCGGRVLQESPRDSESREQEPFGKEQEPSRRDRTPDDIQEWLKWRCYLNHQLSMHILRSSERSDSIDIMSMPEKLDNDVRCAIWSQAQQEIPKTSLNSTAYLVYGIPRARCKPKAFELHQGHYAVPSKVKHLHRNDSRHGLLEQEDCNVRKYLSPTDGVDYYNRNSTEQGLHSPSHSLQRGEETPTQRHVSNAGHVSSDPSMLQSHSAQPASPTNPNLPSSPTNGNRTLLSSPRGRCQTPSIQKQMYKHLARRDSHSQPIMTNSEIVARAKNLKRIENAQNGAPPTSPTAQTNPGPASPTCTNTVYAQLQHVNNQDRPGSTAGQSSPSKHYISGAKYAATGQTVAVAGGKDCRSPGLQHTLRPISPTRRKESNLRPISPTSREVGQLTGASSGGMDVNRQTALNREHSVWRDPRIQSPVGSPVSPSGPSNLREMYKRAPSSLQHIESTNSSHRPTSGPTTGPTSGPTSGPTFGPTSEPTSPLRQSSFRPVSPIQTDDNIRLVAPPHNRDLHIPVTQQYAHCANKTIHAKQQSKSPSFHRGAESLQYKFMIPEGACHNRRYHNVLPHAQQVHIPSYIPPPPPPPLPPKTFSKNTSGR